MRKRVTTGGNETHLLPPMDIKASLSSRRSTTARFSNPKNKTNELILAETINCNKKIPRKPFVPQSGYSDDYFSLNSELRNSK